jgi:hypothetical protein
VNRTIPIFAALLLACSTAFAQIKGPETVKPGDLVHLTIPAPPGADVVFETIEPNDIDFIEYRDGTTAHFVCPAGCVARKIRVLALSINFDTKTIKRERHTIIVEGDVVVPDPPGPGPGPNPTPGKRAVTIIQESGEASPAFSRLKVELRKPQFEGELKSKGHTLTILDPNQDEARALLAKCNPAPKLPALIISNTAGAVVASSELPATAAAVAEAIRKAGG